MAENTKHGKYVMQLGTGFSIFKEVTAPQIGVNGAKDLGNANFSIGYSLLTQPFLMVGDTHNHDFDQAVFFLGGDPANVADFGAEVEMGVDNQTYLINYAACVWIPKGVMHSPLNVKKVNKPIMFIDITLSPEYSTRPVPPGSERR